MTELSDVERDAWQVAEVLAGLAAHLDRRGSSDDGRGPGDGSRRLGDGSRADDDRVLRALAEEGGAAANRVLTYLRALRGAGDGETIAYPPRLGPWRDWCPPRGQVLVEPAERTQRVESQRRAEPRPMQRAPRSMQRQGHGDPGE
jgi:hypothetical protein